MSHQTIIPPSSSSEEKEDDYATFWRRLCAWGIDRSIVDLSFSLIAIPLMFFTTITSVAAMPMLAPTAPLSGLGLWGLWMVADWLYFAKLESSARCATFGKRMMGIVVLNQDGHRMTFSHASGRYFCKYLSAAPMMFGYLLALVTEKKQALHDLLAGTFVYKK